LVQGFTPVGRKRSAGIRSLYRKLQQSGGNLAELRQGADRHLSQLTRIGQSIFGGWSQLAANTAAATS
jgi:hypothetical protein